jgi:hypothetical protein
VVVDYLSHWAEGLVPPRCAGRNPVVLFPVLLFLLCFVVEGWACVVAEEVGSSMAKL